MDTTILTQSDLELWQLQVDNHVSNNDHWTTKVYDESVLGNYDHSHEALLVLTVEVLDELFGQEKQEPEDQAVLLAKVTEYLEATNCGVHLPQPNCDDSYPDLDAHSCYDYKVAGELEHVDGVGVLRLDVGIEPTEVTF